MSIRIIKAGGMDSFQDLGRPGFAHLGIGRGGAMDAVTMQLANSLVGNPLDEAVLEMYAPGATIEFKQSATVTFCGGDFTVRVNDRRAKSNQLLRVEAGDILKAENCRNCRWIYLAVHGGFQIEKIMGSASTHLQANFGGWKGRKLKSGDAISLRKKDAHAVLSPKGNRVSFSPLFPDDPIRILKGPEFHLLKAESEEKIMNGSWSIHPHSDRMAYMIDGDEILLKEKIEMLSSPVIPGTLQLLPSGKMLVLMADAQTVGGYPRMFQVAAADQYRIAQWPVNREIHFQIIDMKSAVSAYADLEKLLKRMTSMLQLRFKASSN